MARLRAHLQAVRAGRPQIVFLEGDAGIGKSRLLRSIQRDAADSGFEVLPGRCLEDFDLPYLPFRSSVLPSLAAVARATPGLEPAGQLFDRVLEAPVGDVLQDGTAFTPEHSRLHHAVATVALTAARDRPILITVDDLHWADTLSVDMLVQLVFEASDAAIGGTVPLGLVVTHRPNPDGRLARDLDRMHREEICHRIAVGPLAEVDAAQIVRDLGLARASRQLVGAILRVSGGTPSCSRAPYPSCSEAGSAKRAASSCRSGRSTTSRCRPSSRRPSRSASRRSIPTSASCSRSRPSSGTSSWWVISAPSPASPRPPCPP